MREVICYNQGEYVQYNFLAGELHKTLKDALRESPTPVARLHELCGQLEEFLNKKLYHVSLQNFRFIKSYFRSRHDKEPRLCIKGHYIKGEEDQIVQLVREKKVNYRSEYPLKENSGFLFVKAHGRYFLCNDIPKSITNDEYRNARIDDALARAYYEHKNTASAKSSENHGYQYDESWVRCWIPPQNDRDPPSQIDPSSCYKSTIIIPITLWNNKLTSSFRMRLRRKHETDIDIKAKTIFGYLCFDHVEENYFNDNIDVDVGYIFADILSLYMITRAIYTELSTTYSKVMHDSLHLITRRDHEHHNIQPQH
ncbi:MAG: hypothetical protein M3461_11755 [Pseudomonadota bacterium]|nr:hypothetical protein [Pseudomonadota bacterium]